MKGSILRILEDRDFGFIAGDDKHDYFFHRRDLRDVSWDEIAEGDYVSFTSVENEGRYVAKKVKREYDNLLIEGTSIPSVYAGMHQKIDLENFTHEEQSIIKTLSKTFYVTNGGGGIVLGATSKYRYCLVKPTDEFRIRFNLNREIVVIFSDYESFEPRTFDAISAAYKRNTQQFRLDKICSVVISKDKNVVSEIRKMLKSDIEMQVVIPFSYYELLSGDKTALIINRFTEYFFDRDLFAFESPLMKDIYFFGRRDYVHELLSRHNSGENSGVFGLRRSGKTSVLQAVKRAGNIIGTTSVFIDCQELYHYRWNNALRYVMACIMKSFGSEDDTDLGDYSEEQASVLFSAQLEEILKQKHNIILLFDEVEQITPKLSLNSSWCDGNDFVMFWHAIRSNFHKWGKKFTFILAGTNPSAVELISVNKHDNPLFDQLKADSYLPPFDVEDTKEMVNKLGGYMGLSFDDIVCANLTKDFGGHPYLIRHFCSAINKYLLDNGKKKPANITNAVYNRVMPVFEEKYADNYCRFILDVLVNYYPEENKFLENLALGNISNEDNMILDPQLLAHLMGYNIIEKNQNVSGFKIDILKNYLKRKYAYNKQNMTIDEKWAEISERRNRVEVKLRNIVKTQLKSQYGEQAAKQKVFSSMKPDIRRKYTRLSYTELFDPQKSEIYFHQIGSLIDANWDPCFKNIFLHNKPSMKSYFTIINNLRAECHAKDVTDDEMNSFRGAIAVLEKEVENYFS